MLLLSRFIIYGHSMETTLLQDQTVLASSIPFLFSKPKVGDIVVIRHSGKRRDVPDGTSRSASRISSQGVGRIRRFWTSQNDEESGVFIKRITKIDGEKYFVSGDNKKDSLDSRKFGWVTRERILGKVIYKIRNP